MKTFIDIPDIGPGTELFSISADNQGEILFRTTTGQYVLEKHPVDPSHKRTYAIINEAKAISWSLQHGLCRGEHEFFRKVLKTVCHMSREESREYKKTHFLLPRKNFILWRVFELLQLPVFRQSLIRLGDGDIGQISTSEIDWLDLFAWINALMSEESFESGSIPVGPGQNFERLSSHTSPLYRATWRDFSITAQCGYAEAPVEFPMEFNSTNLTQGVWVIIKNSEGECAWKASARIAVSAIGLLISSILLYELGNDEPVDRTQLPPDKELFL